MIDSFSFNSFNAPSGRSKILNSESDAISVVQYCFDRPDGKTPDDINKWQSRPDPAIEERWVLLESERPTDNDYIVSENGDWVIDKSIAINSFNKQKSELMNYADKQIELLHDSIEFDIADDDAKDKLLSWRKYRVLLNHVDINSVSNIGWPAIPDVI